MPWGFAAAAVVGAVGSTLAANKGAQSASNAQNLQATEFNTITGQEQPFMNAGVGATNQLANLLGTSGNTGAAGYGSLTAPFTAQDYLANQDPGYQFQLQTGAQALRNSDTPGVGSLSGSALRDLITFNQNTAATGYQNAFNRYTTQQNNTFSRLQNLATLGQNAASNTGQAGASIAQSEGQTGIAAGQAQYAGTLGATNAVSSNALGGLAYLNNQNNNSGGQTGNTGIITGAPDIGDD